MRPLNTIKREIMEKLTDEETSRIKTAEISIRKHRKLRYRLLPYIYSTAYVNYLTGIPLCRPMLLAFPENSRCRQDHFPYQYMFGESFLVAPVYGDFQTLEIYLPPGNCWIDYWDRKEYKGGQLLTYNTTDAEKLPLFIRSGSIIPMRREQNWIEAGETWDPLILDIYPDRSSEFALYEDDGRTVYYRDGQYAKTIFECSRGSSETKIIINRSEGEYLGKPNARTLFLQVNMMKSPPSEVTLNSEVLTGLRDPGGPEKESDGWTYDSGQERVTIRFRKEASERSEIIISQ